MSKYLVCRVRFIGANGRTIHKCALPKDHIGQHDDHPTRAEPERPSNELEKARQESSASSKELLAVDRFFIEHEISFANDSDRLAGQIVVANFARVRVREVLEECRQIVIGGIINSTGPVGGWLDSPKAVNASIIEALRSRFAEMERIAEEESNG